MIQINNISKEIYFEKEEEVFKTVLSACHCPEIDLFGNPLEWLHPMELKYIQSITFERRLKQYLLGRFASKKAIAYLDDDVELQQICIMKGIFQQPYIKYPGENQYGISITHCEHIGAAMIFPEGIIAGIDIERVDYTKIHVFESQMVTDELLMAQRMPYPYSAALALLWSAKEALSKVLRTGLTTPFQIFEVSTMEHLGQGTISSFRNFQQYHAYSFFFDCYVCSIVYPKMLNWKYDTLVHGFDGLLK